MRHYSDTEKELIKKMASVERGSIIDFIDFLRNHYFIEKDGVALGVFALNEKSYLYIDKTVAIDNKCFADFYELLTLVRHLRESGYIDTYQKLFTKESGRELIVGKIYNSDKYYPASKAFHINEKRWLSSGNYYRGNCLEEIKDKSDNTVSSGNIFSHQVYELIVANIIGDLYVSEELRSLVDNNFMTKEELNHKQVLENAINQLHESKIQTIQTKESAECQLGEAKKQTKYSRNSVIFAIVSLCIGMILNSIMIHIMYFNPITIQKSQIDEIKQEVNNLSKYQLITKSKIDQKKIVLLCYDL